MIARICFVFLTATALFSPMLSAQTLAKPSNATGQCKDGTYATSSDKANACRGRNGLREWYNTPPLTVPEVAVPAPLTPQPASENRKPATPRKGPKANLATTPAAPGGASNLVWLNASSNVYHCYGTDFYGKTKSGAYMTEAEAKAKGAHGNRGATCTK